MEQDNTRLAAGVFVRACASLDRHGRGSSDLVEDEMTTSEPVRKIPHTARVCTTHAFSYLCFASRVHSDSLQMLMCMHQK